MQNTVLKPKANTGIRAKASVRSPQADYRKAEAIKLAGGAIPQRHTT